MSVVREWAVSFFENENLTQEINKVDLGEVWENTEREKTIYIRNEGNASIRDLVFKVTDDKVTLEAPREVGINGVIKLVIKWVPGSESLALRDEIIIGGTAVYR